MIINKNRGFTLIELLVVIAIIGILSSVVLASLNTARNKGNNARVKSQLSSARATAEIYYDNQSPNSYNNLCGSLTGVGGALHADNLPAAASPVACFDADQAYAISVPLVEAEGNNNHWCVSSAGASKGRADAVTAASDAC